MKQFFLIIILIFFVFQISAQESETDSSRFFQMSFAYPLSTNGIDSMSYTNNISLNFLYGLNGGLKGFEVGTLFNYNRGSVSGFQLSGIANINTGITNGVMLSGVANVLNDSSNGFIFSLLFNYLAQDSRGVEISVANISQGQSIGIQFGFLNCAKKHDGLQLGIINYSGDADSGSSIGLFNIVKGGLYELEFTSGDVLYFGANYKMGRDSFYSTFKFGASLYNRKPVLSTGIGLGGNVLFSEKSFLSIDISANQIIYNLALSNNMNLLSKLDLNYNFRFTEQLGILIGPSFNVYVCKEQVNGEYGTLLVPYSLYTCDLDDGVVKSWIGLNLGLTVRF
ncbi:MAG: hypothetical protein PQJ46_17340 [Spirochaetales bacterium]|nr:hypothetical protein [Spirochaetales bacterium]